MKLRYKLPLFLVPLVIIPLLTVSWIAAERMRSNAEENILRQMASLTRQISISAQTASETMKANAILFSGSGLLKTFLFTPEEERYHFALLPMLNLFSSYNKAYPAYEEIRVVLPDGYEDARFSADGVANISVDESRQVWFRSMEQSEAATECFFEWNPDTGEPVWIAVQTLKFVDPTFEDSTAKEPTKRGYLAITSNLENIRDFVANTRIGKSGGVFVIDSHGRSLFPDVQRVHFSDDAKLLALAGTTVKTGKEMVFQSGDEEFLIKAGALPGGLILVSYLPSGELAQAGEELVRVVVIIGAVVVVLSVVMLMLILQYVIVYPLSQLGMGAEAIGSGDLETKLQVKGNDEVAHLAEQFNNMAKGLLESRKISEEAQAETLRLKEASIESLRAADKLKDEFLANTSHELRTPLHGITGIAESLIKGAAGPLPHNVEDNLQMIIVSSRRLANLVNDILDFSKLKHKDLKLAKRPVDLNSACGLVLSMVKMLADAKKLELHNNVPVDIPLVMADENRLHQILYNLLGNAVKFTQEGHVSVSAVEKGDMVQVMIEDTGVGVPEEQRELIFDSFEQLDGSLQRTKSGTGLGLAITRQLVESHGGTISVRGRDGGGSVFTFILPRALEDRRNDEILPEVNERAVEAVKELHIEPLPEPEMEIYSSPETENDMYGEHLLVVDDEPVNLRVIENHLRVNGYRVTSASSGVEAQRLIKEHGDEFDLVLLDVMMPGVSGYQVCEEVRKEYRAEVLPIIFLTALTRDGDLEQGFALGGNDYIPKPFSYNELLARIRLHTTLSRQNRDLHSLNQELEERVSERTKALERAYADMENLANLDGLTGVGNRRALDNHLNETWEKRAAEEPLSYLIFDVDFFKQYNDTYGHQMGDSCLRKIADALHEVATEYGSFLGRYGGEEFAIILLCEQDEALKVAEESRRIIMDMAIEHNSSPLGTVTVSVGVAFRSSLVNSPDSLIKIADDALYQAKQSGRNKVKYVK